jgi:hypothetical protein
VFLGILFFIIMIAPIIILWGAILSQSSAVALNDFFAGNWNGVFPLVLMIAAILSIIWGVFISYYFEFVITKTLLQYWDKTVKAGISVSKVVAYTGFSLGANTIGALIPGIFGGAYSLVVPAVTSLIPATIINNPDKSIKHTLQDNKDMFGKLAGYSIFSQSYLALVAILFLVLYLIAIFVIGTLIFYSLDVNTAITNTSMKGLEGNWITVFWDGYIVFAFLSFMLSIIAILFYRVLASIVVSTSLYVWYKNGNNPEEFQKVFLEKAMTAKKAEAFFN